MKRIMFLLLVALSFGGCKKADEAAGVKAGAAEEKYDQQRLVDQRCSVGTGACWRMGKNIYDVKTGNVKCDAIAGMPTPEINNGIDDDCNGKVDDCPGCECVPSKEICDGVDNDCDRVVDNGFNLFMECTGKNGKAGLRVCDGQGGIRCSTDPLVQSPPAGTGGK